MRPDASVMPPPQARTEHVPAVWRRPLLRLALAWLGLMAFASTEWTEMARQWWDASTYNHILLVPFILVWLVWQRWPELERLAPKPWWPGLATLAGALLVWRVGAAFGINLVSQLGAVMMLQAAVAVLLGPRVAAGLLFPLGYMLFLVPFGDELVPGLQMVTAGIPLRCVSQITMSAVTICKPGTSSSPKGTRNSM